MPPMKTDRSSWSILHETPVFASGFQGGVYTDGNEIVIAFGGTSEALVSLLDFFSHPDWENNLDMFLGFAGSQLYDAVEL